MKDFHPNVPVENRGGCGVRHKSAKMKRRAAQKKKKDREAKAKAAKAKARRRNL